MMKTFLLNAFSKSGKSTGAFSKSGKSINASDIDNDGPTILINVAGFEIQEDNTQVVEILPKGEHPHRLGLQVIDADALNRIHQNLIGAELDITIDYNHGSVIGLTDEEGKAAGWIKPKTAFIAENGIRADIQWTDRGAEYVRKKEYRYLSPVLGFDKSKTKNGRLHVVKLLNVGLTNNPNIDVMEPLSNARTEEKEMDELKEIAKSLGLPEDAALNDIKAKIKETGDSATEEKEKLSAILNALEVADVDAATKKIGEITKPPAESNDEVAAMRDRLKTLESESSTALVNSAMEAGKVSANQKAWALKQATTNRAGFEEYLQTAPVIMPMDESESGGAPKAEDGLSAIDILMNSQFESIDKDDLKKVPVN